jgi:hypothetical protein
MDRTRSLIRLIAPRKATDYRQTRGNAPNGAEGPEDAGYAADAHRVVLGRGLGRDFFGTAGTFACVDVGPFTLKRVFGASGPSRIGMGLLSKFKCLFDVPRRRLYLENEYGGLKDDA